MPPQKRKKGSSETVTSAHNDEDEPQSNSDEENVFGELQSPYVCYPYSLSPDADVRPTLGKKKKKQALILTEEQEIELAEWLKSNPMLYTKGMKEYRNVPKKTRLWNEKAQELELDSGVALKTWYDSIRTKVGKITYQKSATKELTEREAFIAEHFNFLTRHISRLKGPRAVNLKAQLVAAIKSEGGEIEISSESELAESNEPTMQQVTANQSGYFPQSQQQFQTTQLQHQRPGFLTREQSSSRTAWCNWMDSMAQQIDDRLLPKFYRESLELVLGLVEESKALNAVTVPPATQSTAAGVQNFSSAPGSVGQAPKDQRRYHEINPANQNQHQSQHQQHSQHPHSASSSKSRPIMGNQGRQYNINWNTFNHSGGQYPVPVAISGQPSITTNMSHAFNGLSDISQPSISSVPDTHSQDPGCQDSFPVKQEYD